jgi:ankyrin repeat protein
MEEIKKLIQQAKRPANINYLFKNMYEDHKLTVVYENAEYFAIVPSGKDGPTPLDDTAKSPMSLIHVLVCPKVEIWNAVDKAQMDKLFNRKLAVECADKAVALLREGSEELDVKLKSAFLENRLKEVNKEKLWSKTVQTKTSNLDIAKELSQTVEYSFHLYPNNSVNHLHMHAWCPKLATRSLDHQLAEKPSKNAPLDLVLNVLKDSNILHKNVQDEQGNTALMLAVKGNQMGAVAALMNHPGVALNVQDKRGRTALMLAVKGNHMDLVVALMNHPGIDLNVQDNGGFTALMQAAIYNQLDIVKELMKHRGINLNVQDRYNNTALHMAVLNNHPAIVSQLLSDVKMDASLKDNDNRTALKCAIDNGRAECVKILQKHERLLKKQSSEGERGGGSSIKQLSKVSEKRYARDTRVQEEIPGYIKSAIQPKPEVHSDFGVLRY